MRGGGRTRWLAVLLVAMLVAALLGACAGSGSTNGSDQFRGRINSPLLDFGEEGSEFELEETDETVSVFLAARSKEDWAATCAQLSKRMLDKLEHLATSSTSLENTSCPAFLEAFVVLSPQEKRESAEIEGGSLRRQGEKAYLIYYGEEEVIYAMPLDREGKTWKIAAISGRRLS